MKSLINSFNKILSYRGDHESDKPLIFIVGAIIIFGMIMLSSASSIISYSAHQDSYYFFKHQLFGLILGLIAAWIFSRIDYQVWKKYALWMLIFSIILLILVFIPGLAGTWGTSKSWINVFGYSLQPSEFVKITFLIYLAAWLRGEKQLGEILGLGPFLLFWIIALP